MEVTYSAYYNDLSGDVQERYKKKIRKCGCDPYAIKKKELSVNPKDFPEITILDIGEYLIHSVSSFTKKKFSAYKSTEAYKHFESGFVLSIGSKKYKEYAILKGRVKHGQKMNETPLHVWVLAHMNGKIGCSHCTCIAGLSETCSHVGAICYAVSNLWESNETKSVTDFLCRWNVPSFKEESMSFVSNIRFRPKTRKRLALESNFVEYCNSLNPFSDETIEAFIRECHSDGNYTAVGSIIFPEEKRKTTLKDELFLTSFYNASNEKKTRRELIDVGKSTSIQLSNAEVDEISYLTLPCHKTKCRFALKRGRVIASNFKDCCNANIKNTSISFINRMMNPISNFHCYPKNVSQKKKKTIETYFKSIEEEHEQLQLFDCGLIINPECPYFAASPDKLIDCDCHGGGCVVIKFLKIMETSQSFEVLSGEPNRILKKNGDVYELEKTHDFYYQLQLHINVTELKYCDLIIWSPQPNLHHLVIRVKADIDFWKVNMNIAKKFHEEIMMPEILGKSYTRTVASNHKDSDGLALEVSPSSLFETNAQQETSKESKVKSNNGSLDNHHAFTEIDDYYKRNLMSATVEEILLSFDDHEDKLSQIYCEQVIQSKTNYRPKDLPDMVALDIVNDKQFRAMANLAESRLVKNLKEEHNSTDVIFDAIIPEWAIFVFCKTFSLTRSEALHTLRQQAQSINISESDMSNI